MQYNTIVVLGKPGSGKGTQAKLLSEKVGFPVLSASGRLKELAASHPDIGQEILDDMNNGVLVPHWIVSYLWISEMVNLGHGGGIIFDGAVRKHEEAKLFHEVMMWLKRPYAVVYLTISNEELHDRLSKRAAIEGRADDDSDVITKRLAEYDENTKESLAFFKEQGTLKEVNGEGGIEEIHERIVAALFVIMVLKKSEEDIALIREAGKRLARIMQRVSDMVAPGISTQELNDVCERLIREGGDTPAFLNYRPDGAERPYPATLCVSINDEAVHGLPDPKRILRNGDIVSLDSGLVHNGRISDMCVTVPVGDIDADVKRLITATKKAMDMGIAVCRGGAHTGDIGAAIESHIIAQGFQVVADLGGHGLGNAVHEEPHIFHIQRKARGVRLEPGMVITIEPTVSEGEGDVILDDDGFTYKTADGSRCAQFEHTILITDGAPEILTM